MDSYIHDFFWSELIMDIDSVLCLILSPNGMYF